MADIGDEYIAAPVLSDIPPDYFDNARYADPHGPKKIMDMARHLWGLMGENTIHPHLAREVIDELTLPPDSPPLSNHQKNCVLEDTKLMRAYNHRSRPLSTEEQRNLQADELSDNDFHQSCLLLLGNPTELTDPQQQLIALLKQEREAFPLVTGVRPNIGTVLARMSSKITIPRAQSSSSPGARESHPISSLLTDTTREPQDLPKSPLQWPDTVSDAQGAMLPIKGYWPERTGHFLGGNSLDRDVLARLPSTRSKTESQAKTTGAAADRPGHAHINPTAPAFTPPSYGTTSYSEEAAAYVLPSSHSASMRPVYDRPMHFGADVQRGWSNGQQGDWNSQRPTYRERMPMDGNQAAMSHGPPGRVGTVGSLYDWKDSSDQRRTTGGPGLDRRSRQFSTDSYDDNRPKENAQDQPRDSAAPRRTSQGRSDGSNARRADNQLDGHKSSRVRGRGRGHGHGQGGRAGFQGDSGIKPHTDQTHGSHYRPAGRKSVSDASPVDWQAKFSELSSPIKSSALSRKNDKPQQPVESRSLKEIQQSQLGRTAQTETLGEASGTSKPEKQAGAPISRSFHDQPEAPDPQPDTERKYVQNKHGARARSSITVAIPDIKASLRKKLPTESKSGSNGDKNAEPLVKETSTKQTSTSKVHLESDMSGTDSSRDPDAQVTQGKDELAEKYTCTTTDENQSPHAESQVSPGLECSAQTHNDPDLHAAPNATPSLATTTINGEPLTTSEPSLEPDLGSISANSANRIPPLAIARSNDEDKIRAESATGTEPTSSASNNMSGIIPKGSSAAVGSKSTISKTEVQDNKDARSGPDSPCPSPALEAVTKGIRRSEPMTTSTHECLAPMGLSSSSETYDSQRLQNIASLHKEDVGEDDSFGDSTDTEPFPKLVPSRAASRWSSSDGGYVERRHKVSQTTDPSSPELHQESQASRKLDMTGNKGGMEDPQLQDKPLGQQDSSLDPDEEKNDSGSKADLNDETFPSHADLSMGEGKLHIDHPDELPRLNGQTETPSAQSTPSAKLKSRGRSDTFAFPRSASRPPPLKGMQTLEQVKSTAYTDGTISALPDETTPGGRAKSVSI
ncbi:MAG: hypothetical protein M1828_005705 [Chrysothrix sp. TS-e1954]|nr:MAG: hypothetical protein M1828_005705 [Chrysothrix sp. TS-e1954]